MAVKRKGLGRGLNELLNAGKSSNLHSTDETTTDSANENGRLAQIPVEHIQRGKYQPRRDMHSEALEELAASIRVQGVMQPIVVRPISGDRYEIIAGERRWRATQLAGLDKIPAVIRDVPDEAAIAMSLIENIQREDLNPVEEAVALKRLQDEFELTHQEVADAVGKSRTTITNLLRLIALTDDVKIMLERGDLEMGHARCLLTLDDIDQREIARQVVDKGLSVRQTEAMVRKHQQDQTKAVPATVTSPDVRALEEGLAEHVGVPVQLQQSAKGKGKLVFSYNSLDELDGILAHLRYNAD